MVTSKEINHVLLAVAQSRRLPGALPLICESRDESRSESRDESRDESHVATPANQTSQSHRPITPANLGAISSYQLGVIHKHTSTSSGEKQNQKQETFVP